MRQNKNNTSEKGCMSKLNKKKHFGYIYPNYPL